MNRIERVLVTGATGYVGGRLIPKLLEKDIRVRLLVRHDTSRIEGRSWTDRVEVAIGDVLEPETLTAAFEDVDAAYYLVHSMSSSSAFEERDLQAAQNFGQAAQTAGVQRIIYLGGLGDPESDLSKHLRSRQKTGEVLRSSNVPVTEFRAAVIVGSGSVSFEIIRYLTERVPIMICPQWVYTRTQPIAIRDVLSYLAAALETPDSTGRIIGIGGPDVLSYGDMIRGYARARNLRRLLIPVPLLTPNLSSYWVHWVTPIPANIARPLIDGLRNEAVVRDETARVVFPAIDPIGYEDALQLALERISDGAVETLWTDALSSSQRDQPPTVLAEREGIIMERYREVVAAPPAVVYHVFTHLGGQQGWLYANWLWRLRGLIDRLAGGVGYLRRRRSSEDLRVGDVLDFWRVEAVEPGRLLRLRSEMKLPGDAWLQFEVDGGPDGRSELVQTAYFAPRGLAGVLYWYGVYPLHAAIFKNLSRRIAREAERRETLVPAGS